MRELPHTKSCFVCGESNAHGLHLHFETDGQIVRARFTPRTEHVGFQGVTHGGILATLLDEIMVWACAVGTKKFGFCAEMTVRFQHPSKPGEELVATAELVENRRGRIFSAKAELRNPAGEIVASSTGKYMPVRDADLHLLQRDMVGNADWILGNQLTSGEEREAE